MSNFFKTPLTKGEVNEIFENFKVQKEIKSGGEGIVYEAIDSKKKTKVAIKLFDPSRSKKRGEREAEKLKLIDSKYLIELIDYGNIIIRKKNCFFSITNFIEGEDLFERLKTNTLSENEVINLINCISKAIDSLWEYNVVHCDIKPGNILYSSEGLYKLIDLGIAKHLDEETITKYGYIFGTDGYMSPEQMRTRSNLTLRSDIFSLGIVAFETLVGHKPFNSSEELMQKNGKILSVNSYLEKKINDKLVQIIDDMLLFSPIDRPISGQEIRNRLKEI